MNTKNSALRRHDHEQIALTRTREGLEPKNTVELTNYGVLISEHINGTDNVSADCSSRAPRVVVEEVEEVRNKYDYSYLNFIESEVPTLDIELIKTEKQRDVSSSEVIEYVRHGWLGKVKADLEIFKKRENELCVEDDCLMLGLRVVIPSVLRSMILSELHVTHMGIVKMKSLARSHVWWPGIDMDIAKITKSRELCSGNASNPPRSQLNVWKWPERLNQRIHVDYLQIKEEMYLVIVDSFSKWLDVMKMKHITSRIMILAMGEYFVTWGFPNVLVSDNGPSLVSEKFESFLKRNGILHVRTAPYHSASNGAAENAVKTFKKHFKLLVEDHVKKEVALTQVLLSLRNTPHCTTGCELVRPNLRSRVVQQQARQQHYAPGARVRSFDVGETVMAKVHLQNKWIRAEVIARLSPVTYGVKTTNGLMWKKHVDQLRPTLLQGESVDIGEDRGDSIEKDPVPLAREGLTGNSSLFDNYPHEGSTPDGIASGLPSSYSSEFSVNSSDPASVSPIPETANILIETKDCLKSQVSVPTKVPVTPVLRRSIRNRKLVQRLDL
ncbi:uncharacterized protein K02A2.6-like [Athalia rosae]|uniref:uncharacterized protein K02A2.6-like n=1 Tax=Athalia rosae TaxID=37344 RepID=UPI0020339050|nr:uncharacterized protein K02A2.6-like [Athalia rosae]